MTDFIMDDMSFYEDFVTEAQDHFENLEKHFLELEENPEDLDVLNTIFRSVHTIKGASGFLGLKVIGELSHKGENILDDLRKGKMKVTPEVIDVLLDTFDLLKVLVDNVKLKIEGENPEDPDISEALAQLQALKEGQLGASEGESAQSKEVKDDKPSANVTVDLSESLKKATSEDEIKDIVEIIKSGKKVYEIVANIDNNVFQTDFDPLNIFKILELAGDLIKTHTIIDDVPSDLEDFDAKTFYFKFVCLLSTSDEKDQVAGLLSTMDLAKFEIRELKLVETASSESEEKVEDTKKESAKEVAKSEQPKAATPAKPVKKSTKSGFKKPDTSLGETIRVSQKKLDTFMNLVGELTISKTMVMHISETIANMSTGEIHAQAQELVTAAAVLDRVSREIQQSVLEIRMVQIKTVFSKFPRMLRDLAKKSGKEIQLKIHGEDTEIDKSIIEEIGDPLIHLIRNSADHGIEMPEEREKAGKPRVGTVTLRAMHEGNNVVVEIEDDGKGIDAEIIKAKALEKGLITEEKAESMTESEIIDLIFAAGFSTAAKVTDISGRGVGMDVVRSNIRKLNGSVSVKTEKGKGSVFTIKLPLTLAIIDALMIQTGGQVFAMPGVSVEETLNVPLDDISFIGGRKTINLRGRVLNIVTLNKLLKLESDDKEDISKMIAKGRNTYPVVVVHAAGKHLGVIVDKFLRRQEIVIKPLAPYLASLPGLSGATIMGDGKVVLILDPLELVHLAVVEASK